AMLYHSQGNHSEAQRLFQEALAMRKSLFSSAHPDLAASLNNLANLYRSLGKYSEAEPLYQQALAMMQSLFLGADPNLAHGLNNLACLYYNQGKYSEAEPLYQQALAMRQHLFSSAHPDLAASLNNLACLYKDQGKYREAEPLFQEALTMMKILFSGANSDLAYSLNNLAVLYFNQGKYSKAEPLYQQALRIWKYLFNGDHPNVATGLNNLANLYHFLGKYREAEPLFQEALAMRQSLFPGAHPDLTVSLTNLAKLYAATNHHQQALELFKEATEIEHSLMSQEFVGSSENDRILFLDNIRATQYSLLSLINQYFYPLEESKKKSQAIHTAFDLVLKRKALSNAASAAFNAAMYSDRYPHLKDSFETWRSRWQQIINLQSSLYLPENLPRLEANKKILTELHSEVENSEKNITAAVPELRLKNQLVNRKAIALELPQNSTLIEFVYFFVYDFTTNQYQNPRYLAFILPAQQPENVQMIDLGEADKIDNLIRKVRQTFSQINLENMGISTKTWKSEKPEAENHLFELTNTIFKPIQNDLQGQQLFICPDGALTLIPFEILPLDSQDNQLLIEQYQITYLTAGRDLLRYKYQPNRSASESLVIADPNFDLSVNQARGNPSTPTKKENLSINLNSLTNEIIETFGQEDNKPFSPVPMTREIAEAAASQFKVKALLQNDALKTYLTNGKCPQNLVIATHGFFLSQNAPPQPNLKKAEFIQPGFRFRQIQTTENPLLRSGLALAGANTWLLGGEIPPEAGEGIVFAQDVAGFDLWANELIILIACETAVGDVKIGEGVKGLRSAFTAAGARLLIMSLWSVPAQVSILLMNRFFVNYQEKNLRCQQALQEAQNYIRTLTRKELESLPNGQKIIQEIRSTLREKSPQLVEQWELQNNPLQARYFWGAWVCVGREF
ncbi:tetratricopeptide repeat protein, partial [Microcoleus sp. C2D2]